MSLIIFLIILSALVIVHEFGHFSVAKYFGIRVDEFGLGFPPKVLDIFSWRGTKFSINWIPFGGFVKIFGVNPEDKNMQEESSLTNSSDVSSGKHGQNLFGEVLPAGSSFQDKNRGIQALVLVAGVVGNFIFAWILFVIGFLIGLPASIVEVSESTGVIKLPLLQAIVAGLELTWQFMILVAEALLALIYQAFIGQADLSILTGPVGLVGIVGDVSALGIVYLLAFTALISINLGLINLLPLPALDGGRLLFVAIESILRRPISPKIFNALNTIGFFLLILLMILITIQDVRNIF